MLPMQKLRFYGLNLLLLFTPLYAASLPTRSRPLAKKTLFTLQQRHINLSPSSFLPKCIFSKWRSMPLHKACKEGNLAQVRELLKEGIIDPNELDKDGKSPLYLATEAENSEVVALLLYDLRVNINQPCQNDKTPYDLALEKGNKVIINLFEDIWG